MTSPKNFEHHVSLVTGGTFGIGRATATALARQRFTVVITGRDATRAQEAVMTIAHDSGNSRVSFLLADFFRPAEVRQLAAAFMATHDRLDVLVNNAGGNFGERQLTPDGFERTWALNHLAYVQLTLALLPLLRRSAPARIVNVASGLYAGSIKFADLGGQRRFSGNAAYMQSKLANLLFTFALARHLAGTGVTANAVNPGVVDTGMGRDLTGFTRWIDRTLIQRIKVSPEQGAYPSVHLATSPEVGGVTGQLFDRTKFVPTKPVTHDEALQERLWQVSLEQLGLSEADTAGSGRVAVASGR